MQKSTYLICYDISNPERLRQVHKIVIGFGDPIQLSVYRCELSPKQLVKLCERLKREINEREDSVIIADLGPFDGRGGEAISVLGRGLTPHTRGAIVI